MAAKETVRNEHRFGLGSKLLLSNALSMLNKNLTGFVQSLFSVQSICTVRKGSASRVGPYMTLQNSLTEVFSNCQLNYNCCLLTIGINTVAVFKDSEQSFKIFDAHSRDLHGMPHSFGKCTLLTIEGIENLVSYLQISCLQIGVVPFEIKGVCVRNNEPDLHNVNESPKIERLPFNNKRNQMQPIKRKLKS